MKPVDSKLSDAFAEDVGDLELIARSAAHWLEAIAPSSGARDSLLAQLRPCDRFARFEAEVAALLNLSIADARGALAQIDEPSAWQPLAPGIAFLPLANGQGEAFGIVGFLRVHAGLRFPEHEHLGHETIFVLQGSLEDENSRRRFGAGEPTSMPAGSRHSFNVPADGPHLLGLVLVGGGIRLVSRSESNA